MSLLLKDYGVVPNESVVVKVLQERCPRLSKKNLNKKQCINLVNGKASLLDVHNLGDRIVVDVGFPNRQNNLMYVVFKKGILGTEFEKIGTMQELMDYYNVNDEAEESQGGTLECEEAPPTQTSYIIDVDNLAQEMCRATVDKKNYRFINILYEKLMIPKVFDRDTDDLYNYCNAIIKRINSLLIEKSAEEVDFIIYNRDRTKCVINSALLDKFGNEIFLICDMHSDVELSYTNVHICEGRTMLSDLGFQKLNLKALKRVKFYNESPLELTFTADLDDIDLENWRRLTHCISDRRDRFPAEFSNYTEEMLCSDLMKAIEIGVKINKYDSSYIKPIYNIRCNCINFIIPYHVGNSFRNEPDLGIVVAKFGNNDYWQVMTLLGRDEVKCNLKLLHLYEGSSFSII